MKLASYWMDSVTPFQGAAAGPVEGKVDVAVIGAGFTGLSAALALAKRGARVAVLDAGRVGAGAVGPQRRPVQQRPRGRFPGRRGPPRPRPGPAAVPRL